MSLKWPTGYRLTETRRAEAAASQRLSHEAHRKQRNFQSGPSNTCRFKGTLPPKSGKSKARVRWYRTAMMAQAAEKQAWDAHETKGDEHF